MQDHPVNRLEFKEGNHSYWLGKKRIPGVTTILNNLSKDALVPWAAKLTSEHVWTSITGDSVDELWRDEEGSEALVYKIHRQTILEICREAKHAHRKKKEEGAWKGSLVHDAVNLWHESYFDFTIPEQPDAERAIRGFLKWAQETSFRVLESERMICDLRGRYCGTTDLVMEDTAGDIWIGDVKTNNPSSESPSGIYGEHVLQAAAYAKAYETETGRFVRGTLIMHTNKDTGIAHELRRKRAEWKRDFRIFEGLLNVHDFRKQIKPVLKTATPVA